MPAGARRRWLPGSPQDRDTHLLPVHAGVPRRAIHWMSRHRQQLVVAAAAVLVLLVVAMQAGIFVSPAAWLPSDQVRMPVHVRCLPPPKVGAAHALGVVTLCHYNRAKFGQVRACGLCHFR